MKPVRPRIGLLALTLELYDELAPDLRESRNAWIRGKIVPALSDFAEVDFPGIVSNARGVESAVAGFESERLDGLLVVMASYSPSLIALPTLQRTSLPILAWNTQELYAVDEHFDEDKMVNNHGVHGTQDLCSVLVRNGVRFDYLTSHLDDPAALDEVRDWATAAAAASALRGARVGLMGYPFPGMGDFAIDDAHLAATLGCERVQLSIEDYINRAAAAGTTGIDELLSDYREHYEIADDITDAELEATARAEMALRSLREENDLAAFSYQFMAFGENELTETVPFVAACRLMDDGIGFAGEGDVLGAAGCLLLNMLQAPASFSEIFTIDFAGNTLFMSHMGEINIGMAPEGERPRMVARGPITRTRRRQLTFSVGLKPGPATLSALAVGPGECLRMIASSVEIVACSRLGDVEAPHFKLRAAGDVRDFLTAYAKAGGPHHNAVCFGDARGKLKLAAGMLGLEFVEV